MARKLDAGDRFPDMSLALVGGGEVLIEPGKASRRVLSRIACETAIGKSSGKPAHVSGHHRLHIYRKRSGGVTGAIAAAAQSGRYSAVHHVVPLSNATSRWGISESVLS